jgi:hypothetical protein
MRITVREETIGQEGKGLFRGQSGVKIEVVANSDNDENLTQSIDEFKHRIQTRATRGGRLTIRALDRLFFNSSILKPRQLMLVLRPRQLLQSS